MTETLHEQLTEAKAANADLTAKLNAANTTIATLQKALDAKTPAVAGPGIGIPGGPTVAWYRPVPNIEDATTLGVPLSSLGKFTGQQKLTALPIGQNAMDYQVKLYAGYGFRPNGMRAFGSEADYSAAQALCDRIAALDPAAPASAAENIIKGAGTNDPTVDLVVIMWNAIGGGLEKELTIQSCLSIPSALTAFFRPGGPSGN